MAPDPASTAYTPQPRGEANIAKTTPTAAAIASTTKFKQVERAQNYVLVTPAFDPKLDGKS